MGKASEVSEDNISLYRLTYPRKLLYCYSKLNLKGRVHDLYSSMGKDVQNNTRTLSIMFEYWLQENDEIKGEMLFRCKMESI